MRSSVLAYSAFGLFLISHTASAGLVFTRDPVKKSSEPIESEAPESDRTVADSKWEDLNADRPVEATAPKAAPAPQLSEVEVAAPVTETFRARRTDAASPKVRSPRRIDSDRSYVYRPRRNVAARDPDAEPVIVTEEVVTPQGKPNGKKPRASAESDALVAEDAENDSEISAAFPFTHLLPSPLNLPGGHWQVGTTVAVGVTDFLQLSTDVVRDGYRFWNINAKVPLIEFPTFVASAYVTWETYNLKHFDERNNPDLRVTSWQPGLVTGYEISDDMAFFVGGNFISKKTKIPPNLMRSGWQRGARVEVDWSWLYNPESSRLRDNAISLGANYDVTYKLWGVGATHHWRAFDAGFHYTVNAENNRLQPIFSFSTGFSF